MEEKQKKEVEKVKEETKQRFEVVEISTETGLATRDNQKEEILSDQRLLVEILNQLEDIKKAVC